MLKRIIIGIAGLFLSYEALCSLAPPLWFCICGGHPTPQGARRAATLTNLAKLSNRVMNWHDSTGHYPASPDGSKLPAEITQVGGDPKYQLHDLTDGWGHTFNYLSNGTHAVLYSSGANAVADQDYARLLLSPTGTDPLLVCRLAANPGTDDLIMFDGAACYALDRTKNNASDSP